ncbi:N-6 DNA methylase [Halococcus salifodinae]|uniref:Type I restriction-modification system methyltransferase subunit-like protein n=1 Tax=Halococcus salifodinae DSM 8989 TaxID=1227456 RepID=M0NAI1_9EURY|nr:N-6 DNA methylase [Halococcus salifodinae]EMA54886.1 Type I restriction-modification system methyltransferase subunit-like protein [Halococcus salifodinae DSM 8989]
MPYLDDTYTKPVLDSLTDVRQQTGHGWSRVFRDWIDIVFTSLQRDDDSHDEMVDRYESDFGEETTQTAFEAYSEGFANLLAAMEKTDADVLGCLYQEYGAPSEENGQHFTPPPTARLLGGMMLPTDEKIESTTPDDPLTIHDPTCGSGSLLVGAGQRLEELADSPYAALFFGQDIDIRCAKMTAINFAIRGLPGFAIHGDSLKADPMAAWKVRPSKGLMGAPSQECEPPQFLSTSGDEAADGSTPPTATDGADEAGERNVQVDVDVELDTQQTQFAAFTDGDSGADQ